MIRTFIGFMLNSWVITCDIKSILISVTFGCEMANFYRRAGMQFPFTLIGVCLCNLVQYISPLHQMVFYIATLGIRTLCAKQDPCDGRSEESFSDKIAILAGNHRSLLVHIRTQEGGNIDGINRIIQKFYSYPTIAGHIH